MSCFLFGVVMRKLFAFGILVLSGAFAATLLAEAPKVDTSTPKATLKSLYDLALVGDFDGIRNLFETPTTDEQKDLLANGLPDDMYGPPIAAALREKFPDSKVPAMDKMVAMFKVAIDKMDEKIVGDTCTLSAPAAASRPFNEPALPSVTLKKVGDSWKLTLVEGAILRLPPAQFRDLAKARREVMSGFLADIKAGKFATFNDARMSMEKRMLEVQQKFAPTTAPATAPSTRPA